MFDSPASWELTNETEGTYETASWMERMPRSSMTRCVNTDTESGTRCKFSRQPRAVTTISARCGGSCSLAARGFSVARAAATPLTVSAVASETIHGRARLLGRDIEVPPFIDVRR